MTEQQKRTKESSGLPHRCGRVNVPSRWYRSPQTELQSVLRPCQDHLGGTWVPRQMGIHALPRMARWLDYITQGIFSR